MTNKQFEQVIEKYKDSLYRFAYSILQNEDDSKDAVVKLWEKRDQLELDKNLSSYCFSTLKNHCLDLLRKQKNERLYCNSIDTNRFDKFEYENIDLLDQIRATVKELPVQQRMVIELKDFQDLNYDEISVILGQTVNNIRVNVSRGRKKLFNIFKEELNNV